MPKIDRYTIGQDVFSLLLKLLVVVYQAQYVPKQKKRTMLEEINPTLDTVKILVRLTRTLEIIDEQQYIAMSDTLINIGRMLGGWINSLPKQDV